jgi:hypothetical protein
MLLEATSLMKGYVSFSHTQQYIVSIFTILHLRIVHSPLSIALFLVAAPYLRFARTDSALNYAAHVTTAV